MNSASSRVRLLLGPLVLGLVVPGLVLSGCGGEASSTAAPAASTNPDGSAQSAPAVTKPGDAEPKPAAAADATNAAGDVNTPAPVVDRMPEPQMPTSNDLKDYPGLKVETLKIGDGQELVVGKKAKVHYIGTLLNGKEFDSTWGKPGAAPQEFDLAGVVPGFRMGLLGMKVGERRRVTIPSEFGYKEAGSPGGGIGPNETLIFDIELVGVID